MEKHKKSTGKIKLEHQRYYGELHGKKSLGNCETKTFQKHGHPGGSHRNNIENIQKSLEIQKNNIENHRKALERHGKTKEKRITLKQ